MKLIVKIGSYIFLGYVRPFFTEFIEIIDIGNTNFSKNHTVLLIENQYLYTI